jgi:hypothetical protein
MYEGKQTQIVKAIELQPGDVILDEGTFPHNLYKGTVKTAVVVDAGVQVIMLDGQYTRPEDHIFIIEAR